MTAREIAARPPRSTRWRLLGAGSQQQRGTIVAIVVLIGVIAAWQFAYAQSLVSRLVLPAPLDVIAALRLGIVQGEWASHILITAGEAGAGFLIGVALAIVVGALFAFVETLRIGLYPYVVAMFSFPKLAIAPLLVTWIGYGLAPKIIIAALLAFFPVLANTTAGLREVDEDQVALLKSLRATRWQELRVLRVPTALAYIFPSLTVAAVAAILGAIVGEFVGASSGLGYLILQYNFQGNTAAVFAVLLVLATFSLSMYALLRLFERTTRFKRQ